MPLRRATVRPAQSQELSSSGVGEITIVGAVLRLPQAACLARKNSPSVSDCSGASTNLTSAESPSTRAMEPVSSRGVPEMLSRTRVSTGHASPTPSILALPCEMSRTVTSCDPSPTVSVPRRFISSRDASRRSTSDVEVRITRTSVVRRPSTFLAISTEPSLISEARRPVTTASRETEAICVATSRAASEVSSTVREISRVVAFCSSMASAIVVETDSTLRITSPIAPID